MRPIFAFAILAATTVPVGAETALVAVATNFRPVAEVLATDFGDKTGDTITLSAGSTGGLAAKIMAGAPYDAFLSADSATPDRLVNDGHALARTRFVYAEGRLALLADSPGVDFADPAALLTTATHIAIANPALAPYGKAAVECLETMDLYAAVAPRIVTAENAGQAQTLVVSGAAELGFVALSGVIGTGAHYWVAPKNCHAPIRQSAALLTHGAQNNAARGFLAYLRSEPGRATIARFGYGVEP